MHAGGGIISYHAVLSAGKCQRARCMGNENGGKPKRAVVLLPGLGNNSQDYAAVAQALQARGLHVQTAAVARADWCFARCPPVLSFSSPATPIV